MNIAVVIIGIIFLLLILIYAVPRINKQVDKPEYSQTFFEQKKLLCKRMSEEQQKLVEQNKKEIEFNLKEYLAQCEAKRQSAYNELERIKKTVSESEEYYAQRMNELEQKTFDLVDQESKKQALELEGVVQFYQTRRQEITDEFEEFQEKTNARREELNDILRKEEAKQQEIIEGYKRAEQIKQDKNFYRIVLNEDAQDDVKKLRKIAGDLHDPIIIYKLIYKTYYEKPFTEMVGRVVSNDASSCGIYKITNIENGRCYIGQTRQAFKERWRTHLKRGVRAEAGTSNKLYQAMWDDGAENFTFEVLAQCPAAELNAKEKEYIALYHADTWGYNGNSGIGV